MSIFTEMPRRGLLGNCEEGAEVLSTMACLDPVRSASLAAPARAKTKASSKWAMSTAAFT
jgi:hypothetical protein